MKADQIYETAIKPLSPSDRLRIATLILNEIPPESVAEFNDTWSDQDLQDFTVQNWAAIKPEDEGDLSGSNG
ncbi:MAG: hypothetical protein O3B01_19660 [Planctomycetota bacterium]|nr:hypothetical protein [Planctomycetota bacterium]MDA1140789.1 hypothetical protein [Planctomycetota bacterium]